MEIKTMKYQYMKNRLKQECGEVMEQWELACSSGGKVIWLLKMLKVHLAFDLAIYMHQKYVPCLSKAIWKNVRSNIIHKGPKQQNG